MVTYSDEAEPTLEEALYMHLALWEYPVDYTYLFLPREEEYPISHIAYFESSYAIKNTLCGDHSSRHPLLKIIEGYSVKKREAALARLEKYVYIPKKHRKLLLTPGFDTNTRAALTEYPYLMKDAQTLPILKKLYINPDYAYRYYVRLDNIAEPYMAFYHRMCYEKVPVIFPEELTYTNSVETLHSPFTADHVRINPATALNSKIEKRLLGTPSDCFATAPVSEGYDALTSVSDNEEDTSIYYPKANCVAGELVTSLSKVRFSPMHLSHTNSAKNYASAIGRAKHAANNKDPLLQRNLVALLSNTDVNLITAPNYSIEPYIAKKNHPYKHHRTTVQYRVPSEILDGTACLGAPMDITGKITQLYVYDPNMLKHLDTKMVFSYLVTLPVRHEADRYLVSKNEQYYLTIIIMQNAKDADGMKKVAINTDKRAYITLDLKTNLDVLIAMQRETVLDGKSWSILEDKSLLRIMKSLGITPQQDSTDIVYLEIKQLIGYLNKHFTYLASGDVDKIYKKLESPKLKSKNVRHLLEKLPETLKGELYLTTEEAISSEGLWALLTYILHSNDKNITVSFMLLPK